MKRFVVMLGLVFLIGVFSAFSQPLDTTATQPEVTTQPEVITPQETDTSPEGAGALGEVGGVLLIFLVLSIVFESALSPVFNWRVFRNRFDGKGVKTPITVLLAFVVFWGYGLDIVYDLLNALGYQQDGITLGGQALTALLIAGGSSGIFNIYKRLGIRSPGSSEKKPEDKPAPPTEG